MTKTHTKETTKYTWTTQRQHEQMVSHTINLNRKVQDCKVSFLIKHRLSGFLLEDKQIDYIFYLEKQLNINSLENLKKGNNGRGWNLKPDVKMYHKISIIRRILYQQVNKQTS